MTIVPDSIEPYYGYKALSIRDGLLYSPSHSQEWPPRAPVESECRNARTNKQFTWKAVPCPEGWDSLFWVPSRFLAEQTTTHFSWPTEPAPEGFTYIPEEAPHDMGGCSCGIYVVETVRQAQPYMTGDDRVIVWLAVWGQVVIGDRGARGQYAYPQKMWCGEQQADQAKPVAANYDIPLEIVIFTAKENE